MKWERPPGALDGPGPLVRTAVGGDTLAASLLAHPPRRILLIMPSFVGDAVMATGALQSVIARFPDAHLTLETTRRAMGIFDNVPGIHARRVRFDRFEKLTSVVWLRAAARFDLAILLEISRRRAKVARWGGIRRVVGVREADGENWLMASVRWESSTYDLFDPLRGLLAILGADLDIRPRLFPDDAARRVAARVLDPLKSQPVVGLFVDASRESKRWPIERFLELAARLEGTDIPVVAIAGVGGEGLLEPFKARRVRTAEDLSHPLALGELIRGFVALVTNDSGPAHIADAVGTPAVVLYGPTSPARFALYGDGHWLIHSGFGCDVYLRRCVGEAETGACDRRCMNAITVDEVFDATMALVARIR